MIYKGVLSIDDPCGRYMGMQSIARNFLTGRNIDISYLGPAEHPTAVVLTLTPCACDPEEEERAVRRAVLRRAQNLFTLSEEKIREQFRNRGRIAMHMKADYFVNATSELFATLLSKASSSMDADVLFGRYGTYNIYYNNGLGDYCTKEEFYSDNTSFIYVRPQ